MIYLWLFIAGACIGSFLSCLVYRLNASNFPKRSDSPSAAIPQFLIGRSVCDHCGKQLAWYDNIPLISYLTLRGKCRQCRSPIPVQYFLTELGTGIITFIIFIFFITSGKTNLLEIISSLTIVYFLTALFISDLNHQTIPDLIIFPAIIISLIFAYTLLPIPYALPAALISAAFFFLLSRLKIRGRQAMGFGDVELVFLMGLFLGFPKIIPALYIAFLTGAVLGVILIILGKKKLQSAIPFGPFLIAGTIIAYFWGEQIIKLFITI